MDARQEAKRLYLDEHLSPTEIAKRLGIQANKIRSWKSRYKWDAEAVAQHSAQRNNATPETAGMDIPLTDAQEEFCQVFVRQFNATVAYQKSHPDCTYLSAMANGSRMLHVPKIRDRIQQLKLEKAQTLMLGAEDIVERHMRIAFADISNYVLWGYINRDNQMTAVMSNQVDGSLVKMVSKSDKGFRLELHDPQKSLEWLGNYFSMNPMDRHKIDFDNRKISLEEQKINGDMSLLADAGRQTVAIADLINTPADERPLEDYMPSGGAADDPICAADDEAD